MSKSESYTTITGLLPLGKVDEAERLIIRFQPTLSYSEHSELLGNVHFYRKEFQEAIPLYEAAMEASPEYDCARYHYLIGVQDERKGQLTAAFKRYQAAIEIESGFVDAYIELGGLLCKVGDFEGALKCYTDALSIDDADLAIHHNLVTVLSQLAQADPKSYSIPLSAAQMAYLSARQRLDPPAQDRVW